SVRRSGLGGCRGGLRSDLLHGRGFVDRFAKGLGRVPGDHRKHETADQYCEDLPPPAALARFLFRYRFLNHFYLIMKDRGTASEKCVDYAMVPDSRERVGVL